MKLGHGRPQERIAVARFTCVLKIFETPNVQNNRLFAFFQPENILCLARTGFKIKIIDFGLAREMAEGEVRVMFGTPEFVAPEVISFDPVTYATDMWSVGVICYVL